MTEHLTFILEKPAKNLGGDKYKCKDNDDFIIYIPQFISRNDNKTEPKKTIRITID
jgi:hypothetical protein